MSRAMRNVSASRGILVISTIVSLLLASCGGASSGAGQAKGAIGFSFGLENSGIYPFVVKPARVEAKKLGYTLLEGNANGNCETQVANIEGFISRGVKAIVVNPICAQATYTQVVGKAVQAGIKVIGYANGVTGQSSSILWSDVQGATGLANWAVQWYHENFSGSASSQFSWVLFNFDQCGTPCLNRTETMKKIVVQATGVNPLVAKATTEEEGLSAMETFLQRNPNINMVLGINDAGALGAYQALSQQIKQSHRDPSKIFVAGIDGQIEAVKKIAAGGGDPPIYRGSAALLLDQVGREVVDLPDMILSGKLPGNPGEPLVLKYVILTTQNPKQAADIAKTYEQFVPSK